MRFLRIYILIPLSLLLAGLIVACAVYVPAQPISNRLKPMHKTVPNEADFFETAFSFDKKILDLSKKKITAGIIPHHLLAADMIAEFFSNLAPKEYDTIILIGPNHYNNGGSAISTSAYDWQTPYGMLNVDRDALETMVQGNSSAADEEVMPYEHSITSEVSFIKRAFPKAHFLPLILKSTVTPAQATQLAKAINELGKKKKVLVLASIDFSHYKDSQTAQTNDRQSLLAIYESGFSSIYNLDIDSPPSLYTLLQLNQLKGGHFELLNHSNSAIRTNKPELERTTSYVTGYFVSESASTENQSALRVLFFGDLMLDRGVKEKIDEDGFDSLFSNIAGGENRFFRGVDMVSANLEGTVTDDGTHYDPQIIYDFAFDPLDVAQLKKYHFNFFNVSNNHYTDQGKKGVEETQAHLDALGYDYSGCIDGIVDDCSSTIITKGGMRIGMIGFSMVYRSIDIGEAVRRIGELAKETDIQVVNIHWGVEYAPQPSSLQKTIAHQFIDAGADVIIGHHPHVIQPMEVYKNKAIFYSLGNFIFDQKIPATYTGLGVGAAFYNDKAQYYLYPFDRSKITPKLLDYDASKKFCDEYLKDVPFESTCVFELKEF